MRVFYLLTCLLVLGTKAIVFEKNILKSWKNNDFYGFRGIRYAEPPTGSRRFMAPVPAKTWGNLTAIFEDDLTDLGSRCPQANTTYNEDCLFLNVYTKTLNTTELKPVIVFINPGGLLIGEGNHGAEKLLEKDIVLVTFNFRLGTLGFSSTGTPDVTPNAGFKDQVLVLKWVRDHIDRFGGNPNLVTIMGVSSGALSVELHLVSPLSRGLFHRVIQMSGGIMPQREMRTEQKYLVERMAKLLNCSETIRAIDCLKKASAEAIADNLWNMFDFGFHPSYPWWPVIEPPSKEAFLYEDPFKSLAQGDFAKVPLLLTQTTLEWALFGVEFENDQDRMNELLTNFNRIAPICYMYEPNGTVSSALYEKYIEGNIGNRKALFNGISQSKSAAVIYFPEHRLAQLLKNQTDVYLVRFSHIDSVNRFPCKNHLKNPEICEEIESDKIVAHSDDTRYLFTWEPVPGFLPSSVVDASIVEKYTQLVTEFAKTGVPDYSGDVQPSDAKYDDAQRYVDLGNQFTLATKPFAEYELWDQLFPIDVQVGKT